MMKLAMAACAGLLCLGLALIASGQTTISTPSVQLTPECKDAVVAAINVCKPAVTGIQLFVDVTQTTVTPAPPPTPVPVPTPVPQPVPNPTPTPVASWSQLPNTKLRAVCPPDQMTDQGLYQFSYYCRYVVTAWNSAATDTKRNRLVIFGGGHADYYGNELYALSFTGAPTLTRLTDPSTQFGFATNACAESYPDGKPTARHTYDGLIYLPVQDALMLVGGSRSQCGFPANDVWYFSFATNTWEKQVTTGTPPDAEPGFASGYDPVTGLVFVHANYYLHSFDPATKVWKRLTGYQFLSYLSTGVMDPVRKKFYTIGGDKAWAHDLVPPYTKTDMLGVPDAIKKAVWPGLAWDGTRVVAWAGGDMVHAFDGTTWTSVTAANGPGPQVQAGTYKRWAYSALLGGFVLINNVDQDVWLFR